MHDFLIFCAGAGFALAFVIGTTFLTEWDIRRDKRHERRMGYVDFTTVHGTTIHGSMGSLTVSSSNTERGDASANPDEDELSGGGSGNGASHRPRHLRSVDDGN